MQHTMIDGIQGYRARLDDLALIQELKKHLASGAPLPDEIPVPAGCGFDGKNTIPALKKGIERFIITDINCSAGSPTVQFNVRIAFDFPDHHKPNGMNVLFMDGHIEFKRFGEGPGSFPATSKFLAALDELVKLHQSLPKDRASVPASEPHNASQSGS